MLRLQGAQRFASDVYRPGWPHVQHRGGDTGFIKILDSTMIGWVERNGNRQYIGTGNNTAIGKVGAVFVDYPNRTRLEVYGMATEQQIDGAVDFLQQRIADLEAQLAASTTAV